MEWNRYKEKERELTLPRFEKLEYLNFRLLSSKSHIWFLNTHTYTNIHTLTHTHIHKYTHTHTHTHIHKHTNTHIGRKAN